jgi:hypothetical protein
VDETRKGLNFHAFVAKVSKAGYGRVAGRQKVADPWFPTTDELVDLARWPRDDGNPLDPIESTGTNRFSYIGVAPKKLLGDLNTAKGKPGDYFNLENLMAIVANRAMNRYENNTAIGQRYYNEMRKCVREAQVGRKLDGDGGRLKKTAWKLLEQWIAAQPAPYKVEKKSIVETQLKIKPTTVLADESTTFAGQKYEGLDWAKTKKAITAKVGKKAVEGAFYKDLFKFIGTMSMDMVSCASAFVS